MLNEPPNVPVGNSRCRPCPSGRHGGQLKCLVQVARLRRTGVAAYVCSVELHLDRAVKTDTQRLPAGFTHQILQTRVTLPTKTSYFAWPSQPTSCPYHRIDLGSPGLYRARFEFAATQESARGLARAANLFFFRVLPEVVVPVDDGVHRALDDQRCSRLWPHFENKRRVRVKPGIYFGHVDRDFELFA